MSQNFFKKNNNKSLPRGDEPRGRRAFGGGRASGGARERNAEGGWGVGAKRQRREGSVSEAYAAHAPKRMSSFGESQGRPKFGRRGEQGGYGAASARDDRPSFGAGDETLYFNERTRDRESGPRQARGFGGRQARGSDERAPRFSDERSVRSSDDWQARSSDDRPVRGQKERRPRSSERQVSSSQGICWREGNVDSQPQKPADGGNFVRREFAKVPKDVLDIIEQLDKGEIRVCDNIDGEWVVNEEAKQTIISLFQLASPSINVSGGAAAKCVPVSYDKIPLKFASWQEDDFAKAKIRVGHGAVVRYGVFLDSNVVLMNCFVNIGAHIGEGTMVDSFATVGSCARVGKRCHIAAGVVIGGVLEPVNARPVIIEDDCLLGAHVAVVEGVIVRCGATIAMGTRLGASTKIIERDTGREFDGEVPECAVVVPGFYEFAGLHISCAVIVGYNRQGTSGVGRKSKEKPEERDGINVTLRFGTE